MSEQEYQLGDDVTEQFAPQAPPETAVLSVDVNYDLLVALDNASEATGRSYEDLVSTALAEYLSRQGITPAQRPALHARTAN